MAKQLKRPETSWPAWFGLPVASAGAGSVAVNTYIAEAYVNRVEAALLAACAIWLIATAIVFARRWWAQRTASCAYCNRVVPVDFLEEISADGVLARRDPVVACRHCLCGEDYPS